MVISQELQPGAPHCLSPARWFVTSNLWRNGQGLPWHHGLLEYYSLQSGGGPDALGGSEMSTLLAGLGLNCAWELIFLDWRVELVFQGSFRVWFWLAREKMHEPEGAV